jgi:hypothetical protein
MAVSEAPGMASLGYDSDSQPNWVVGQVTALSRVIAAVDHWFAFDDILKTEEGDQVKDQEWKVGGRKVISKRGVIDTNACCGGAAHGRMRAWNTWPRWLP